MTENTPGSVHRRTVVAGAAWTVPVVATAIGAPLAAASGDGPTLTFTNGLYTVAACGTLTDVVIKATTDGTAAAPAGTPVTVTLPDGLTWPGGGNEPRNLPVVANGEVVLSGLKATASGGSFPILASTSATVSTSTLVSVSAQTGGAFEASGTNPTFASFTSVPADAVPVGGEYFLTPSGDLYFQNTKIRTGVAHATGFYTWGAGGQGWWADYTLIGGGAFEASGTNPTFASFTSVPADAVPVGGEYFLTPSGDLYFQNTKIRTGVAHATGFYTWGPDAQGWWADYILTPTC